MNSPDPYTRRRKSRSGSRVTAALRSWRVLVFAAALLITFWTMNQYMSNQHAEHVTKGIMRRQNDDAAMHATASGAAGSSNGASQKLRGKQQVKQPRTTGSGSSGTAANGDERTCSTQEHAEYGGDVVQWGTAHLTDTAKACCEACRQVMDCNIFVWCGAPGGCGGSKHRECWLKRQKRINYIDPDGASGAAVLWTSGAVGSTAERKAAREMRAAEEAGETERLKTLKENATLPLLYLDVEIDEEAIGRMLFVVFVDEAPIAAENFRQIFSGEMGYVPKDGTNREGEGMPYHIKGKHFYRIIHRFIDQTGADVESVYGGRFDDDPGGLKLRHDRKGLLSVANQGPNTTTSHFSILQAPAPHLNGQYTIFGELVEGWDVAAKVNALSIGKQDNTAGRDAGARIYDAGQLRSGSKIKLPPEWQAKLDRNRAAAGL